MVTHLNKKKIKENERKKTWRTCSHHVLANADNGFAS